MKDNWNRLAMDLTHHNGENFLTIIDCAPSRFAIWWPLRRRDAPTIIQQWENGPLMEILTNNDAAFTSKDFGEFARNWDVHLWFRCAYSPSGNGIVERSHRTISPQSVKIDGVPRHVKDFRPVIQMQLSLIDESNSEDSEHLIYLNQICLTVILMPVASELMMCLLKLELQTRVHMRVKPV